MRANGSAGNRELLHDRVRTGVPTGLLASADDKAVGWVAVAPWPTVPRLAATKATKPVDPAEDLTACGRSPACSCIGAPGAVA